MNSKAGKQRRRILLATLFLSVGCATDRTSEPEDPLTPPNSSAASSGPRMRRTASGQLADAAHMKAVLDRLTRGLALALRDDRLRNELYRDIQASTYPEHKLHLRSYLAEHAALFETVARKSERSAAGVLAALDSTVDIEIYLPVKEHYSRWKGGRELIVASLLEDDDEPVAFDIEGRPVKVNKKIAPDHATLVLVQVETDFSPAPDVSFEMACPDGCGSGGGGTTEPPPPPPPPPGIYMTYLSLVDDGEDNFFRGDPEIEVMLIGRTLRSGPSRVELADDAANEGPTATGVKRFNHNGSLYTAPFGSPGVLVARKTALDRIRSLYPGVPADSVPFNITVWEDDTDRGVIVDPDNIWADEVFTTSLMIPAIQLNLIQGRQDPWAGVLFVVGLLNLLDENFGAKDDFLGTHVDRDEYRKRTGILVSRTHVLMKGNQKRGEMTLVFRN